MYCACVCVCVKVKQISTSELIKINLLYLGGSLARHVFYLLISFDGSKLDSIEKKKKKKKRYQNRKRGKRERK